MAINSNLMPSIFSTWLESIILSINVLLSLMLVLDTYLLENSNHSKISQNKNIRIINIPFKLIERIKKLPTVLYFILRCIIQTILLVYIFIVKIKTPELLVL